MIRKLAALCYFFGLCLISFTHFRVGGVYFNFSDLLFLVTGILMAFHFMLVDRSGIKNFVSGNILMVPIMLFLVGAILSLIQTEYYLESFIATLRILFIFVFWIPVGVSVYSNFENIKLFKIGLLIGFTLPIFILLLDKFVMHGISLKMMSLFNCADKYYDSQWNNRHGSYMGHPNNLATLLVCAIPYYYYLTMDSRRWLKLFYLCLMCAGGYALLITGSRAALASLFLSMSVLFILYKNKKYLLGTVLKYIVVVAMVLSVLVVVSYDMPDSPVARLMDMKSQEIGHYRADQGRVTSARDAIDHFSEHILTGIGVNYASALNEVIFVHNTFLKFAAAIGIFGVLSLIAFYGIPIIVSLKIIRSNSFKEDLLNKYAFSTTLGWILFDMFQPQFHQRIKWVTVVVIVICYNYQKKMSKTYDQR